MYNFTDHCWLTSIAKVVLRTFQLKFTLFLHQYIVMENRISVIIDQWTKKKLMKNNLPASSPNRVSNIPTNANISIAVHKDLVDMWRDFSPSHFPMFPSTVRDVVKYWLSIGERHQTYTACQIKGCSFGKISSFSATHQF